MSPQLKALFAGGVIVFLTGCAAHDTWSYRAVTGENFTIPNQIDTRGALVLKTNPPGVTDKTTPISSTQKHTVLMASWHHESASFEQNVGRTLIVLLEGQPKPGQYWLTPDNSVLLTYSAYSAPARERVNLTGSIRIDRVDGNKVVASVAVRDTNEIDSSEFLNRPFDPVTQQFPFLLKGKHEFAITTPGDPIFEKSAVKWITQ